ncbi:MAG: flagellar hook-basal body complex protein FliE [Deltaproteobacteria bacterium]|jgi:flagellar hook-basal body complex protein FliE|nr:flagellar hook-basal body complex protein FliE [Deltaproteobacteria bacterium]
MSIQSVGLKAYTNALSNFAKAEKAIKGTAPAKPAAVVSPFADTLKSSLAKVNDLQQEKKAMITSFASGEQQNVHELMISLQKAGLAMNMTAAVRNKAMEAYRELARMQF